MRKLTPTDAVVTIRRPKPSRLAEAVLYVPVGADFEELLVRCNAAFAGPEWIGGPALPPPSPPPAAPALPRRIDEWKRKQT